MGVINSNYTKRFQSSFKSSGERVWQVNIYDRLFNKPAVFQPYDFEISDTGLTIQWDSEGDEKFAPIVGSKCSINFMMDANTNGHTMFFNDILGIGPHSPYNEQDLMVYITEQNTGSEQMIFVGEYMMDLDTLPDIASPFPIQLTFTDGIGKLKEIEFKYSNLRSSSLLTYATLGFRPFPNWIGDLMQQTGYYQDLLAGGVFNNAFFKYSHNTEGFTTCVRWYNADHYWLPTDTNIASDALNQTACKMEWTESVNSSNGSVTTASCYEVLKQICRAWGMRVIAWQGIWHFQQIRELDNENTQSGSFLTNWGNPVTNPTYRYYVTGAPFARQTYQGNLEYSRFNNYMYNGSAPGEKTQKLSGGVYKFLPILREVVLNLVHEGGQNIFGGYPPLVNINSPSNFQKFLGGPYQGSTGFSLEVNLSCVFNAGTHPIFGAGVDCQLPFIILALEPNATNVTLAGQALATLTYNPVTQSTGWDSSPVYTSSDLGESIWFNSSGGPYPAGTFGAGPVVPLSPNFTFSGYRDEPTDYAIMWQRTDTSTDFPRSITPSGIVTKYDGASYGSTASFYIYSPGGASNVAGTQPAWGNGFTNQSTSYIRLKGVNVATANTVFTNTGTDNSNRIEWGDIYFGDGPEYFDSSALLIKTQSGSSMVNDWDFTNWTEDNWAQKNWNESLPAVGSGTNFNNLLAQEMKVCQATVLKRANFKLVDSPITQTYGGNQIQINPIGNIRDIYPLLGGTGAPLKRFFFKRGVFNMITNEWEGEWIEGSIYIANTGNPQYFNELIRGGGSNLLEVPAPPNASLRSLNGSNAKVTLFSSSVTILKDVAITSLAIADHSQSSLKVGTNFECKIGDKLFIVYSIGLTYEITLTADVLIDSTEIEFSSITPTYDSDGFVVIQIPLSDVMEQSNRKTRGKIAGFDVSATALSKGGISIDGFLDSDTMAGASASTLPTSESVKAYIDNENSESKDFCMVTCSAITTSSATDGEASGVVIQFDTKSITGSNSSLATTGAEGLEGISDSTFCWSMGGVPPVGIYEMEWNITSDVSVAFNRTLGGVKLQQGTVVGDAIVWADEDPSHSYMYDRGMNSSNIRQGSSAGSILIELSGSVAIYYRLILWKNGGTNASSKLITQINGCQVTIQKR